MKEINSLNPIAPSLVEQDGLEYQNVTLNIPKGSLESYKANNVWNNFWNIVETDFSDVATSITLDKTELQLAEGECGTRLKATVLPTNAANKSVIWVSSDENVATVDEYGYIIAANQGTCEITAITRGISNLTAKCVVSVKWGSNYLTTNNIETKKGTNVTLPVAMINADGITAFQCDIFLPDGVTIAKDADDEFDITLDDNRKTSSHTLTSNSVSNGAVRVVTFSPKSSAFVGNDGTLFNIKLNIADDSEDERTIEIKNIILTRTDAVEYTCKDIAATVESFENYLTVNGIEAIKGTTATLPVAMTNKDAITAFQCDIFLPDGVTIAKDADDDFDITLDDNRKTSSHTLSSNSVSNGSVRVVTFSPKSSAFVGNDGGLFNIKLNIADNAKGEKTVEIKNIVLTSTNAVEHTCKDIAATVDVLQYILGDSNLDNKVNVTDAVGVVNIVLGTVDVKSKVKTASQTTADEDRLNIEDITISAGETKEVSVNLDNETVFTAFQCDIFLPEGLTIEQEDGDYVFNKTARMTASHVISSNKISSGAIRVVCFSSKSAALKNTSGALFTFNLIADADFKGSHTIDVKNILFTTPAAIGQDFSDISANVAAPVVATSIVLNQYTINARKGEKVQLEATVLPDNATNKAVKWESSDETIATVDETGLVTLVKSGEAKITAKTTDGRDLEAVCNVNVSSGVDGVNDGDVKVISNGTTIYITGVDEDMVVEVYNTAGIRTYIGQDKAIEVPVTGVYVVKVAGATIKVVI